MVARVSGSRPPFEDDRNDRCAESASAEPFFVPKISTETVVSLEDVVRIFPNHFVLCDQCRFDTHGRVTHGRILESTSDRDRVYSRLREHPNSVIVFTGPGGDEEDGAFLDGGQAWSRVEGV